MGPSRNARATFLSLASFLPGHFFPTKIRDAAHACSSLSPSAACTPLIQRQPRRYPRNCCSVAPQASRGWETHGWFFDCVFSPRMIRMTRITSRQFSTRGSLGLELIGRRSTVVATSQNVMLPRSVEPLEASCALQQPIGLQSSSRSSLLHSMPVTTTCRCFKVITISS